MPDFGIVSGRGDCGSILLLGGVLSEGRREDDKAKRKREEG